MPSVVEIFCKDGSPVTEAVAACKGAVQWPVVNLNAQAVSAMNAESVAVEHFLVENGCDILERSVFAFRRLQWRLRN